MSKLTAYFKDVHNELINKTSWPTWSELTNSAIVVMVASLIIAAIIFGMDSAFDNGIDWIYRRLY
ncbi:preprotein translocase subunit SecE [Carboxylicivirga caseinilyticus]|uniref:preprotein translocase subunit SecE n=1 Tax=Carboxylicivirga caseinilyticus TaxID=3417572 RepID=UPI002AA6B324|nr:preprotein translocase subunit SecE [uncultured Carboxylicivirga sp.]MCU4164043.1 preprotein translocase subunit SecE [Marinilabiliaceae bacterium A049]